MRIFWRCVLPLLGGEWDFVGLGWAWLGRTKQEDRWWRQGRKGDTVQHGSQYPYRIEAVQAAGCSADADADGMMDCEACDDQEGCLS